MNDDISLDSIQNSIDNISLTLEYISNPINLMGLEKLPEHNKLILLDLIMTFIEEGKKEFEFLKNELMKYVIIIDENSRSFDVSAELIYWVFQTGEKYEEYTEKELYKFLQALINCFIYSKGEEIQNRIPIIPIDNFGILIRDVIMYKRDELSKGLLSLFKKFENIVNSSYI